MMLSNLHLNDNTTIPRDNKDKIYKLGPFVINMKTQFDLLHHGTRELAADESIILFKATEVSRLKKDGKRENIASPEIIPDYNHYMGGVDQADRLRQAYCVDRSKKWWHRLFFDILDIAFVHSYVVYKCLNKEERISLLDFRRGVAKGLMIRGLTKAKLTPKRASSNSPRSSPRFTPVRSLPKRRKYSYSVANDRSSVQKQWSGMTTSKHVSRQPSGLVLDLSENFMLSSVNVAMASTSKCVQKRALSEKELQDITDSWNFDESDLDVDLLPGGDSENEDETIRNTEDVLQQTTCGDEDEAEADDDGGAVSSSDDELPLVHFLPKGKKRKWKQSAFVPRIAVKHTPTVRAEPLPENISDPIRYFSRYLDDDFFESMALFTNMKEGKPHPVGLKNFVVTTSKGIPLDLQMYEGKGKSTESCLVLTPEKLDVGGRVALRLADTLPVGVSLFTDRFFTSIPLIETLLARGITLTGTLMKNRIPKEASFRIDNQMKKSGRGSYDMLVTENNKIALVKWYDSKPVHIGSSEFGTQPVGLCNRWSKVDNKYLEIQRPSVVKSYNENMGGVDLLDRVISNYRMNSRTTKWTIRAIYHFVDFSAAAGLLEYREDAEAANVPIKEKLDYLDFKFSIAKALLSSGLAANPQNSNSSDSEDEEAAQLSRKRRRVEAIPEKRIRKKESKHLPHFIKDKQKSRSKCRYPGCKKLTFAKCSLCNVFYAAALTETVSCNFTNKI
ncbi:hypothetical protein GEV33_004233 [Tenebrio molitor]|uniref:PiggyBac transposable element-derived protein domain-containing protein n=1 Tax=Tenebrio molitor TaxID=7067 RepID=A0A8J6LGI4_TENMO|nr:hypothetical protein GEV33_004233 [Tenebrio molitor]